MYDPVVDGQELTFDVFGLLEGVFTMVDRQTSTLWTHLDGQAIRGPMEGDRMIMVSAPQTTWGQWREDYPDTLVLSPDTPFRDRYRPARIGVFNRTEALYGDDRLPSNTLVVGVEVQGEFKGYPILELGVSEGVVNDEIGGEPVLVIYDEVSRTGVAFSRHQEGQVLEFDREAGPDFTIMDRQTGTRWSRQGKALEGPLEGSSLQFVPSFISEWYGWSAYHPESGLFELTPQ